MSDIPASIIERARAAIVGHDQPDAHDSYVTANASFWAAAALGAVLERIECPVTDMPLVECPMCSGSGWLWIARERP